MLRSVKELRGYKIQAQDGEIGKMHAFLFDDHQWVIRYLIVNTGNWLAERLVLIVPGALEEPDWAGRVFPVNLTCRQVEESPDIEVDKPVSRQQEMDLHRHYNWTMYWTGEPGIGAVGVPPVAPIAGSDKDTEEEKETEKGDPNLRSTREVIGYQIEARDGEIGHLDDFIVDDEGWFLRYAVVDTRDFLPGRKVLIAVPWIERVDWHGARVHIDLMRGRIENSPEFDPEAPVNREYEERLYDYYGRPRYWT